MKALAARLCPLAGLDPGTPRALSPQARKEMAAGTQSISRIAASRRSRAQDRDEAAPGCRGPMERRARKKRSSSVSGSGQPAMEKLQPPSAEHVAASPPAPAPVLQPPRPGRGLFPAVPTASSLKPGLSLHAGTARAGKSALAFPAS
nr:guanine nucleotide-binding protein G(s) subunit alpha isoforms XLas-like [Dasypus novemcinctus]